ASVRAESAARLRSNDAPPRRRRADRGAARSRPGATGGLGSPPSAADGVALPPPRGRRCAQLSVLLLDRRGTSERPVGPDGDLMAAGAQILHVVRAEPPFERERPWREPARIERRDEVVGVELRCVDRLLEVEAAIDVSEEDVERPLLLLVAAR